VDPSGREVGADPRAERATVGLLIAASLAGVAFCVLYATDPDNQLLGLALGAALAALAGACIVAALAVVPRETAVEERPALEHPDQQEALRTDIARASDGISRRRLLVAAAGTAGAGLAAAAAAPIASLGPNVGEHIVNTPWRRGRPLVDERGVPLAADDLQVGQFATAYPQGADIRELGSPVVVVRVRPDQLRLPPERAGWAPEGLVAFSKICTHAGCAVALFRSPLYQPTSKSPALVCPCHYSTFDVLRAGAVQFGPAGRPLPQLPLAIRADRTLVAAGGFSGPIGPAWWSVRRPRERRS
jgi:ubiquinol-cytochrome c reductase iron-sulfur subunit